MANTAMSKGDMRGACKSYMRAQKRGVPVGNPIGLTTEAESRNLSVL
jgi:hypothetical protein